MRVVHLVHNYPPEFRGGTEACVESLAAEQLARGDEPLVITGSELRDAEAPVVRDELGQVSVWRIRRRADENYSVDARLERVTAQVLRLLEEAAPAVVHLHHTLNLSADLASRIAQAGYPVVATLHDYTLVCARFFLTRPDGSSCAQAFPLPNTRCFDCVLPDFPGGKDQLEHELRDKTAGARREAAAMGAVLVPSRMVADRWERSGLFAPGQLEVLPHAPRVDSIRAATAHAGVNDPSALRLVTWGHLAPAKGVHDLIQALRLVADERLSLKILGAATDAAYGERLRELARGLPVEFTGAYESDQLAELAAGADLAVFPSRAEETFGLVVAEARSLGLAVITSDRGALPESLGQAGCTVPAGEPQALADRLKQLLDDRDPLDTWRRAAHEDLLDPATHAQRVDTVYQRVIKACGKAC